jgi:hypothetical protein
MIRLQWNSLRVGHHVLVHDDDHAMKLVPGRVTMIQTAPGSNDLTIRITPPDGPSRSVHPRRLAVHLDTGAAAERCWRCEENNGAARPSR